MRILIVDDSIFAQKTIKKQLEQFVSPEIIFASSGEMGYDLYISEKPDFVITDLLMPGIGGEKMIKVIKEYDANSKIIIISSDIQKAVKEEMQSLGVLMFINKPLDKEKTIELINILGVNNI